MLSGPNLFRIVLRVLFHHPALPPTRDDFMKTTCPSRRNHGTRRLAGKLSNALGCLALALLAACASPQMPPPGQAELPAVPAAPAEAAPRLPEQPVQSAPAAAVAPEKIAALRSWVDQQERLYALAAPLLINSTPLCKRNAQALLGLTAKTQYSYSNYFADAARTAYGLDNRLRVMSVLAGSGAEKSGMRRGDVLLAIEGRPLPKGPDAEQDAARLITAKMRGHGKVRLTVEREGAEIPVDVPLTQACAISVELGNSDDVAGYADGRRAMVTRGMLAYTRSDDELAYVLAKEIAHAVLMVSPRPNMAATIEALRLPIPSSSAAAIASHIKPYSPVMDATADKLSLYMLARAGYKIDDVLPFWKKLADRYPVDMRNAYTSLHPSTAYRVSVMTAVLRTVKDKLAHHWPLVP